MVSALIVFEMTKVNSNGANYIRDNMIISYVIYIQHNELDYILIMLYI